MIVEAPDGSEIEFPDSMSHDEIKGVMAKKFPPVDTTKDIINSGIQGMRNVAEGLIAAPGITDDIENSVVSWLKSQGDDSVLGRLGNNYQAVTDKILGAPDQRIAMPNYGDVQWTEKQLGLRDQYQPQTPAGNLAYGGAVAGLGGAIGGPVLAGPARAAAPYAGQFIKGGLQGAGLTGGGYGAYKLYNQFFGQ